MPATKSFYMVLSAVVLIALFSLSAWLQNPGKNTSVNEGHCVLDQSDCEFKLGAEWGRVSLSPRPVPIEEPLNFVFYVPDQYRLESAHIEGVNMYMGRTVVFLDRQQAPVTGMSFLGSCREPSMHWKLVMEFSRDGNSFFRQLDFHTHYPQ
ncbi:hypothetical protein [Lacimicrobium sp. SS2-24]|uniref:hypothetical protein n=1 Tax=Lacimicrobium sp. SS2-24 TaxID=2005569 RepID=UPI000B4BA332|nr:hypothetical protein [Lacimicrobium sp. SS2-24]